MCLLIEALKSNHNGSIALSLSLLWHILHELTNGCRTVWWLSVQVCQPHTVHLLGVLLFWESSEKISIGWAMSCKQAQFLECGPQLEHKQAEVSGNGSEHRELKKNSSWVSPGLQFLLQKKLLLHQILFRQA